MPNSLRSSKNIYKIVIGIVLVLLLVGAFTDWIVKWLWLDNLGYASVFWTIKITQGLLLIGSLIVSLLYIVPNMNMVGKKFSIMNFGSSPLAQLNLHKIDSRKIKITFIVVGCVIALFFSLAFFMQWDTYFRFHWSEVVGRMDPIFGHDIGFYMFRLPFIELVQNSLVSLSFFMTLAISILYVYSGAVMLSNNKNIRASNDVIRHISLNLGLWLLLLSWGYYLQRYKILFNGDGTVFGADYVDVHVQLPIYWIMCVCCLLLGLLAFYQIYKRRFKWLMIGGIVTLVIGGLVSTFLPGIIQQLVVEPNELQLEKPYIKNNISATRAAYKLDSLKIRNYAASDTLKWQQIQNNQATISNIRLWDPHLLIQTYRQLQEIRLYYQFFNVDVDRYHTTDDYLQMMLSARELSDKLPKKADTWVNRRLQYTHGYGLVMSPVAQQGDQGDPKLIVKDLPPVSPKGLKVNRPAIYYGEHNQDYKIVNTKVKELDYPKGDHNVYTHYSGNGGVSIDNFFEKLLFSWEMGDMNILLSDYITNGSKIMFWKTVRKRVKKIAPFLRLEEKPYLALSNGKLYWIQDAYTISTKYPYSTPDRRGQYNFIRNSVKVIVDAYNGSVDFYSMNKKDPILDVYKDVFPDMFKPLSKMPAGLKQHLRYPEHLFTTQLEKYSTFHMTDPQVFYNNEDLWTRPNEKYSGRQIKLEPYYLLSKLPGEKKLQYLLISPLTPKNKDNMIAWMAAKSDFPEYGEVSVFELPKERLILGPAQIEAKIDQNTEISRQLSLWDQRGSNVIRGNLMVVPVGKSFLYVEPVFLIASGVNIPQLQRVIATDGENISMAPTLHQAINGVYGRKNQPKVPITTLPAKTDTVIQRQTSSKLNQLQKFWDDASKAMQNNNWTVFGEKMKKIKDFFDENDVSN